MAFQRFINVSLRVLILLYLFILELNTITLEVYVSPESEVNSTIKVI